MLPFYHDEPAPLSKSPASPSEPEATPRRHFLSRRLTTRKTTLPPSGRELDAVDPAEADSDDLAPSYTHARTPDTSILSPQLPLSPGGLGSHQFGSVNSCDYAKPQSTAEGWSKLAKTLISHDETIIKDYKEDMDTLLVFAGLFSAVVTAFLVIVIPALSQDSSQLTQELLTQISTQITSFTISNGYINSTVVNTVDPGFTVSSNALFTNALWFASLFLSLVTASLAMLVKQWLREYMTMGYLNPQACARIRHYRYKGLRTWRVFQIAEVLPLLLQASLILFLVGLSYFIRSHHALIGWIITGFIIIWIVIYQATFTAPMFASNCPYKTPLFRSAIKWFRRVFQYVYRDVTDSDPEDTIRRSDKADYSVLASADGTFVDTEVLETIRECLSGADGDTVLECVRQILSQRGHRGSTLNSESLQSLQGESSREKLTLIRTMLEAVERDVSAQLQQSAKVDIQLKTWMTELLDCSIPQATRVLGSSSEVYAYVLRWLSLGGELAVAVLTALTYTESTSKLRRSLPTTIDREVFLNVTKAARTLRSSNEVNPIELCRVVLCFGLYAPPAIVKDHNDGLERCLRGLMQVSQRSQRNPPSPRESSARNCFRLCKELNHIYPELLKPSSEIVRAFSPPISRRTTT